jgi:hypothetical protein
MTVLMSFMQQEYAQKALSMRGSWDRDLSQVTVPLALMIISLCSLNFITPQVKVRSVKDNLFL